MPTKEFKLSELFTASNGSTDIQSSDIDNQGDYVITSGTQNNGILGKSSILAPIFKGNSLTVDMFGNVFYRDFSYKMVTHARVFSLSSKMLSHENGLFIAACLQKITCHFSYANMCSWNKIKNEKIALPVLPDGTPNYQFMENYIRAIEKKVIQRYDKDKLLEIHTTQKVINMI